MKAIALILAGLLLAIFSASVLNAQQVTVQLVLPSQMMMPGIPFWMYLGIQNQGAFIDSAHVFVALNIGTDDYWFWPSWCHYPPETDWLDTDITPGVDQRTVFEFIWPSGAGSGNAQFLSAVVANGELASNVSSVSFTWTDALPGFVRIPSGSFTMGSPAGEMCRSANEVQHTVNLTHGFYIQKTEVTQSQWIDVFGLNPSYFVGMGKPVEQVSWFDCCIYCNRLSIAENLQPCYYSDSNYNTVFDGTPPVTSGEVYWLPSALGYRLPTESEWEYACRAGTDTAYNSAQNPTACGVDPRMDPLGWYSGNSVVGSYQGTQPGGLKEANAWDLVDMHGNVSELCWDWRGDYPAGSASDPIGPVIGTFRVSRGGSWVAEAEECRSARRAAAMPDGSSSILGFRVVRSTL